MSSIVVNSIVVGDGVELSVLHHTEDPNVKWMSSMELHALLFCPSLYHLPRNVQLSKKASYRQELAKLGFRYRAATREEIDMLKSSGRLSMQAPSSMLMRLEDACSLMVEKGWTEEAATVQHSIPNIADVDPDPEVVFVKTILKPIQHQPADKNSRRRHGGLSPSPRAKNWLVEVSSKMEVLNDGWISTNSKSPTASVLQRRSNASVIVTKEEKESVCDCISGDDLQRIWSSCDSDLENSEVELDDFAAISKVVSPSRFRNKRLHYSNSLRRKSEEYPIQRKKMVSFTPPVTPSPRISFTLNSTTNISMTSFNYQSSTTDTNSIDVQNSRTSSGESNIESLSLSLEHFLPSPSSKSDSLGILNFASPSNASQTMNPNSHSNNIKYTNLSLYRSLYLPGLVKPSVKSSGRQTCSL